MAEFVSSRMLVACNHLQRKIKIVLGAYFDSIENAFWLCSGSLKVLGVYESSSLPEFLPVICFKQKAGRRTNPKPGIRFI